MVNRASIPRLFNLNDQLSCMSKNLMYTILNLHVYNNFYYLDQNIFFLIIYLVSMTSCSMIHGVRFILICSIDGAARTCPDIFNPDTPRTGQLRTHFSGHSPDIFTPDTPRTNSLGHSPDRRDPDTP